MMKIKIKDFEKITKYEKYKKDKYRELNAGLSFKVATDDDRKKYFTDSVIYRFEFPHISPADTEALFNRLNTYLRRNIKEGSFAMLGLSKHQHYTPYALVSGSKGGHPKKVFNHAPSYQRPPHIHLDIMGNHARSISERIYNNQSRYMKLKPFKDTVRSKHYIYPSYIEWQSSRYSTYPKGASLDSFLSDEAPLNFSG